MKPMYLYDEPEKMKRLIKTNSSYANEGFQEYYAEEIRHVQLVALLTYDTARKLGMLDRECWRAFQSGLEHDLGKGGLPPEVLFSTEVYDPIENPVRGLHVDLGVSHGRQYGLPEYILDAIQFHHETFKEHPTSYPGRIHGKDIPLYARLIAPADNFLAITRDRVYRKALSFKETERIMMTHDYFKFDPEILAKFLELCYDFHKQERNLIDVVAKYYYQKKGMLTGQKL